MKLLKRLICKIGLHKPILDGYAFTDRVSELMVFDFHCAWCDEQWLANGKYSMFKCYRDEWDGEQK